MSDAVVTAVCQMFAINTSLKYLCFGGHRAVSGAQLYAMRRAAAATPQNASVGYMTAEERVVRKHRYRILSI